MGAPGPLLSLRLTAHWPDRAPGTLQGMLGTGSQSNTGSMTSSLCPGGKSKATHLDEAWAEDGAEPGLCWPCPQGNPSPSQPWTQGHDSV